MARVVVTGATGFVGSFVCRELLAHGYEVVALRRASSAVHNLAGAAVHFSEGDITDLNSLTRAFEGAAGVFHIAALYREAKFPPSEYLRVNAEGTKNVFRAAANCNVSKVIHCSTIGVHSHIAHPPATENEPYAPTDVYQESKVQGEKIALEFFQGGVVAGAIIRPAMIWGPRDTRFLKMFRGIKRRRMPLIGTGQVLTHWILVTDLARAFRLAFERAESLGQIYIIAGGRPVTLEYTYQCIAKTLGVSLLPLKIPVWPFQLAGSIVESLCRPFGIEPPIHRRRADFFIKNRAFDCSKAARELQFSAEHTFEAEVALIASWYEANKWI